MKKFLTILLVLALALSLVACTAKKPEDAKPDGDKPVADAKKFCLIVGNLGDNSFADSANAGAERAKKELGVDVTVIEYGSDKTVLPGRLLDAADQGFDMIAFGNDADTNTTLEANAAKFPNTSFLVYDVDSSFTTAHKNVLGITFKANESDFLAAVVASKMSKTGKIGWMGGDDYVALHDFLVGYAEGCVYANPENRVAYVFIAEGNNSWANPAKGKELSMALYNNYKTDFIHGVAGGSGDGVFEAVLDIRAGGDKSVWAIGVDADQYLSFMAKDKKETAETILTSALKTVGQPIFAQLQKIVKGEATESGQATYGIAEGAAGIAINDYYKANTPQDVQDFLTKTVEQVSSGTVKVTSAYGLETEALNAIYAKTTVK